MFFELQVEILPIVPKCLLLLTLFQIQENRNTFITIVSFFLHIWDL